MSDFPERNIGTTIRELRLSKGWDQKKFAEMLTNSLSNGKKISLNSVSNWEIGNYAPDKEVLETICKVFKISLPELLYLPYSHDKDDYGNSLTEDEKTLIEMYRKVNKDGQERITDFASKFYNQCLPKQIDINYPLFLSIKDFKHKDEYDDIINEIPKLKKLRRKTHTSYDELYFHLCDLSPELDSHICLAFVWQILNGQRCPSRQLYNIIYSYLSNKEESNNDK